MEINVTVDEINKIISKVKVGQIYRDNRPPKFVGSSGMMEIINLVSMNDYAGNPHIMSVAVSYTRNPLGYHKNAPKVYQYGRRKFAENFTLLLEKQIDPPEPLEKCAQDRFDSIID